MHKISKDKVNYKESQHLKMMTKTFVSIENIKEKSQEHLKQLESFNEQLSRITSIP